MEAVNRYLYSYSSNGTRAESYYSSALWAINHTDQSTAANSTQFKDTSGRFATQYEMDHITSVYYGGAEGNLEGTNIDGILLDNFLNKPRTSRMDYNRDGVADNRDNTTVQTYFQKGCKMAVDRLRANYPNKLVLGNIAEQLGVTDSINNTDIPVLYRGLDLGGLIEWTFGAPFSYENWGDDGTGTLVVSKIRNVMSNVSNPTLVLIGAVNLPSTAAYSDDNYYRDMRYSLAGTLVSSNASFAFSNYGGDTTTHPWFPEYNFNLGLPLEAPKTAATANGIWRRDFENGIVLWAPRKSLGTINLGGTFYVLRGDFITPPLSGGGTATYTDSTVRGTSVSGGLTPGQSVTSVNFSSKRTLPSGWSTGGVYPNPNGNLSADNSAGVFSGARDGLILSRTPT
jgi:hypothetical protein